MPELSIVVPTYNERANLVALIESLDAALGGIDYEVVIVDDDSPDNTAALARSLAQHNGAIRVLHRLGRRGLSSAAAEGILSTSSPYIAVMDADLQHDERILPRMLEKLKRDGLDLVVGSRYVAGGSIGALPPSRARLSKFGGRLSRAICHADLSDPMSGYFVMSRSYFHEVARSLS